jgi:hypothetical protein
MKCGVRGGAEQRPKGVSPHESRAADTLQYVSRTAHKEAL